MPEIEATDLKLVDARAAVSRVAIELGELRRLVLLRTRPLVRPAKNVRHTENEDSGNSSPPESHTAYLATVDDGVTAGAVRGVPISTHLCAVFASAW